MRELNREIYTFDGFRLDPENRQLHRGDQPLALPPKAFDLLLALVANRGRLVGKDELFASVWRDQIVEESNLTVYISQIRKALGETKKHPRFIETVPGYGYRFIGGSSIGEESTFLIETETLSRVTIEKENEETQYASDHPSRGLRNSVSRRLGVGAAALLLASAAIFWVYQQDQDAGVRLAAAALPEKQTSIKRLTSKGAVDFGVLSPDGQFFAYASNERGRALNSLWLGRTSGNGDVQLRRDDDRYLNPRSFSADGNWLYYTASEPREFEHGTLYKMPALGGVPQKLVSAVSVYTVVSPDEKRIAFVRHKLADRSSALFVANLDGSGEKEIARRPVEHSFLSASLAWSSDGDLLSFGAENGRNNGQEIFVVDTRNGSVRQITSLGWTAISRTAWRRDDEGLLIVGRDANSFAGNQLWQIAARSGEARKVTRDLQHYGSTLSLSADSNTLLALQAVRESSIWIAPANDRSTARQITFGSAGHEGWFGIDWTPDGKIVYVARFDQSLTLWTIGSDGEGAKQLTSAGFLDERPTVTPDGKYIVFQSNRSGETEIWRVNSDGTDPRQLTADGGKNIYPHVTPDGQTVVFTHTVNNEKFAWRVSIEGGETTPITSSECFNARVSPDGDLLACGTSIDGKTKLAIISLASGSVVRSFDVARTHNFDGSIRWSPDGRVIIYRDWEAGIWSQPVDGGDAQRLEGLPTEKLYQFDWSSDGKYSAYVRGREIRDIVLISGF